MTLHISAVGSLMTVLVTSALAFTDLAGGAAGIAKLLFYISAVVLAGLFSAELVSIRPVRPFPLTYFSSFISLIVLLVLNSAPAYGEWVKVDTIEISESTVYAEDPSTIHREGNVVKMWALFDYKTKRHLHGGPWVLSYKNRYEYECAEKRQRLLANMWFSGHMGSGEIVDEFAEARPWHPVLPEGPEHSLWIAACSDNS